MILKIIKNNKVYIKLYNYIYSKEFLDIRIFKRKSFRPRNSFKDFNIKKDIFTTIKSILNLH